MTLLASPIAVRPDPKYLSRLPSYWEALSIGILAQLQDAPTIPPLAVATPTDSPAEILEVGGSLLFPLLVRSSLRFTFC